MTETKQLPMTWQFVMMMLVLFLFPASVAGTIANYVDEFRRPSAMVTIVLVTIAVLSLMGGLAAVWSRFSQLKDEAERTEVKKLLTIGCLAVLGATGLGVGLAMTHNFGLGGKTTLLPVGIYAAGAIGIAKAMKPNAQQ